MAPNTKNLVLSLNDVGSADRHLVGGKAAALARLLRAGIVIPPGLCITTMAYQCFVQATDLQTHVIMKQRP